MSNNGPDSETVELALQLSGLSITVRGAPDRAADFIRRVSDLPSSSTASVDLPSSSEPVVSGSAVVESPSASLTSIEETFEPCPENCLVSAASFLRSTRVSSDLRAKRAWIAGQWAKAFIEGRVSEIPPTPEIGLPQKYWALLRSPRCRAPRLFQSFGKFSQEAGSLSVPGTVGHDFATETEAFIYLQAAGVRQQVQYYN